MNIMEKGREVRGPSLLKGHPPLYATMARLAVRRPGLIPHMLGAAWAFRARGWYRRIPFLPLPSPDYMRWRLETAFGDADATPTDDETARFLVWATEMRARMRRRRR